MQYTIYIHRWYSRAHCFSCCFCPPEYTLHTGWRPSDARGDARAHSLYLLVHRLHPATVHCTWRIWCR